MYPDLPAKTPHGHWVQTDKATHEAWADLSRRSPLASQIMHLLVARVGAYNAVVISQAALADLAGASRRGVQKALRILQEHHWLEPRQIGSSGSVNAYVLNDRVAWAPGRDGLRCSQFSATVVAVETEQPDRDALGNQAALRRIPTLNRDGMQPPASPPFPGGPGPDLPARRTPGPGLAPDGLPDLTTSTLPGYAE